MPANQWVEWSAGITLDEKNEKMIKGKVLLEQIWNLEGNRGIKMYSEGAVSILVGKSIFLPPKE